MLLSLDNNAADFARLWMGRHVPVSFGSARHGQTLRGHLPPSEHPRDAFRVIDLWNEASLHSNGRILLRFVGASARTPDSCLRSKTRCCIRPGGRRQRQRNPAQRERTRVPVPSSTSDRTRATSPAAADRISRPPSSSRRWTRPYCRGPATPRKMRSSRITTGECARCSLAPIR